MVNHLCVNKIEMSVIAQNKQGFGSWGHQILEGVKTWHDEREGPDWAYSVEKLLNPRNWQFRSCSKNIHVTFLFDLSVDFFTTQRRWSKIGLLQANFMKRHARPNNFRNLGKSEFFNRISPNLPSAESNIDVSWSWGLSRGQSVASAL